MNLSRQANIVRTEQREKKIVIIGCGGIGSNVAHILFSTGFTNLTLFDGGDVAAENIAPQFFTTDQIGLNKAMALKQRLAHIFSEEDAGSITAVEDNFRRRHLIDEADIVIVGTDSMESRRSIWGSEGNITGWQWWIDARMGGTQYKVLTVGNNRLSREAYATSLIPESTPLPCGEKATAFITKGLLPGLIGGIVYNLTSHNEDVEPVPFMIMDTVVGLERLKV